MLSDDGGLRFRHPEKNNFMKRSQDLKDCYHDAGQFIVGKTKSWLEKKPIVEGKTLPIIVPRIRVQDIDNEEDIDLSPMKEEPMQEEMPMEQPEMQEEKPRGLMAREVS